MGFVVVVPGEPLGEMEVLAFDGITGVEEDIKASVLETVVELLDLPIVFGMVGLVPDVGDSCLGTGCGEARAPLPSAVCPNGTNNEGGVGNDVMEKRDRRILITMFVELRHCEPGVIIDTIETHSRCSPPRETRIHLEFLSDGRFHVPLGRRTLPSPLSISAPVTLPDTPDGAGVDTVFLWENFGDVVDVPLGMIIEHLKDESLRFSRCPVPGSPTLRSGLLWKETIDSSRFVAIHPFVNGKTALLHRTSCFCNRDRAFENTFNNRGLHRCEGVISVGFHAATVEHESVSLIAAIRTKYSNYC